MIKSIFIFIAKIIGYFLIIFTWFRLIAPFFISYPSNTLVIIGVLGSIAVTLLWLYFIIKTIQKFFLILNKTKQNENN